MSADQVPLRDSAKDSSPIDSCSTGAEVISQYRDYIARCASEFVSSYDDRQDLAAEIHLVLLRYRRPIEYPAQFVRTVARNLAINRCVYGSGAWEVSESEFGESVADGSSIPFVEYLRSKDLLGPDPSFSIQARDTLIRLEKMLSPSEKRCYDFLKQGFEQEDLSELIGITKQAVSKLIQSIRRKFLVIDGEDI